MRINKFQTNLFIIGSVILLTGCAGVKIYSDKDLKSETGIPIYAPKPFLLVEYNSAKDVASKATIIYLPDGDNVIYAKSRSGLGSAELKFDLKDGVLTSYGLTTDSKVPEALEALTKMATGVGGLLKSDPEQSSDAKPMAEALVEVKSVVEKIEKVKLEPQLAQILDNTQQSLLTQKIIPTLATLVKDLTALEMHTAEIRIQEMEALITDIKTLESKSKVSQTETHNKNISDAINGIQKAIQILKSVKNGSQVAAPTFELFEIKNSKGTYSLVKVK